MKILINSAIIAILFLALTPYDTLGQSNGISNCDELIEALRSKRFNRFPDTLTLEIFLRDSTNSLNIDDCSIDTRVEVLLARSRSRRKYKTSANRFVDSALSITTRLDTIATLRAWNEKLNVTERDPIAREAVLKEYTKQAFHFRATKHVYLSYFNLGQLKRYQAQYNDAIKTLMIADSAFKTTATLDIPEDKIIGVAILSELAAVYSEIRDTERSFKLYRKAMALCGECRFASIISNNLGNAFITQNKADSAIRYLKQGLNLTKSEKTRIYSNQGLAAAYIIDKDYKKSMIAAQYVLKRIDPNGSALESSMALNVIAAIISSKINLGSPDSAIYYFETYRHLAPIVGYTPSTQSFYRQGFRAHLTTIKDEEKLTSIFDSLTTTMDSVYNKNVVEQVQKVRESYQANERESELKSIQLERNLTAAKANQRLALLGGSSLAICGLVAFSIYIYRNRKELQGSKEKIEKLNTNLSFQNRSIQALNRELNHRAANQLSLAYELILDQRRQIGDEQAKASLQKSESQLMALREVNRALANKSDDLVQADQVLQKVAENLQAASPHPFKLDLQLDAITIHGNAASRSALILSELMSNSIKYAFPNQENAKASLSLKQSDSGISMTYVDNGPGKDGRTRGTGVGSELIEAMLEDMDAEFDEIAQADGTGYGLRWWWG